MLNKKNKKIKPLKPGLIGVFDSGLGGLTVFSHILKTLPNYNYIYLGDNARLPYGEKSAETIYEYSRQAATFLFEKGCNLIIVACNTASAQALKKLQTKFLPINFPDKRILGVIRPLAEEFAKKNHKIIGIIGTKATINSGAYQTEINHLAPQLKIEQKSTPLLVPLIEEGWLKKPETKMILKKYLRPLKTKQVDALILGCTHYPFLLSSIKQIMGKKIAVPDPGVVIANSLKNYLDRHPELNIQKTKNSKINYYTTDNPEYFKKLGEKFLGQKIINIKQVDISEL